MIVEIPAPQFSDTPIAAATPHAMCPLVSDLEEGILLHRCHDSAHPEHTRWLQRLGNAVARRMLFDTSLCFPDPPRFQQHLIDNGHPLPDAVYQLSNFPDGYKLYHVEYPPGDTRPATSFLYGYGLDRMCFKSPEEFIPHLLWLYTDQYHDFSQCSCKFCFENVQQVVQMHLPSSWPCFRQNELVYVRIQTGYTRLASDCATWKVFLPNDNSQRGNHNNISVHQNYMKLSHYSSIISDPSCIHFWPAVIEKRFMVWSLNSQNLGLSWIDRWKVTYEYEVQLLKTEKMPDEEFIFRHQRFRRVYERSLLPYRALRTPQLLDNWHSHYCPTNVEFLKRRLMSVYSSALKEASMYGHQAGLIYRPDDDNLKFGLWLGAELILVGDTVQLNTSISEIVKRESVKSILCSSLPPSISDRGYLEISQIELMEGRIELVGTLLLISNEPNGNFKLRPNLLAVRKYRKEHEMIRVPIEDVSGRFYPTFPFLQPHKMKWTIGEPISTKSLSVLSELDRMELTVIDQKEHANGEECIVLPIFSTAEPKIYAPSIMQHFDYPISSILISESVELEEPQRYIKRLKRSHLDENERPVTPLLAFDEDPWKAVEALDNNMQNT